MPYSQHTIAGTVLTMRIKIRAADWHTAMFSVDADAAQNLIDYSGLEVCRYRPDRTLVTLMLARYFDGDLGRYHEFATAVWVNSPGSDVRGPRALTRLSRTDVFIHHLPVDKAFTMEAGQRIWGFPKVIADFTVRDCAQFGFDLHIDGQLVAGMEFRPGLPMSRGSRSQVLRAYSHRDGVTREIPYEVTMRGTRARFGGARLWLGDHPYAKELAALGLPKRALVSTSVANVAKSFGDARVVA
jgi:Acetoacetate decarboxylase (ADC)